MKRGRKPQSASNEAVAGQIVQAVIVALQAQGRPVTLAEMKAVIAAVETTLAGRNGPPAGV